MSGSAFTVTGLGFLTLGALAAGWLVVLTPNPEIASRSVPSAAVLKASTSPVSSLPPVTAGPSVLSVGSVPPGQAPTGAEHTREASPRSPGAVQARRMPVEAPTAKSTVVNLVKPASRIVAEVKNRISETVALVAPHRVFLSNPPRDHRFDGVLTASEIGRIKGLLRLSSDQEPHWPPVAELLRTVGRRQMTAIQAGQAPGSNLGGDLMQFYFAARPLLQSLREDQKAEVRRLARRMGFASVASYI